MTSSELEFMAECEHRSACARLVTLRAPMYTDDFDWCMCGKCPYHGDRLGKNAKLRDENEKLRKKADISEVIHKNRAWHDMRRKYRGCGELILDLLAEVEASTRFKRRVHPLRYKEYAKRAEELGIKEVDA